MKDRDAIESGRVGPGPPKAEIPEWKPIQRAHEDERWRPGHWSVERRLLCLKHVEREIRKIAGSFPASSPDFEGLCKALQDVTVAKSLLAIATQPGYEWMLDYFGTEPEGSDT